MPAPRRVSVPGTVTAVSVGYYHMAAISEGKLYTWGSNARGQLGLGLKMFAGMGTISDKRDTPQHVALPGMVTLIATDSNSCAAVADGRLFTWGQNDYGQLGLGHTYDQNIPELVNLTGAARALAFSSHSAAAVVAGTLYTWGSKDFGGNIGRCSAKPWP